ncbi:MAG TPA: MBL fold metallo-hydrolase [Gaiellaceae bacterium]|jgi:L-ascorbate metabolism protein UlaG (beta-lactamase superfamily)|nr:MBL fold metallo-hydrolase [Gaiellaceae bacterium]
MELTLVRNATLLLELAGKRVLVDPMLDEAGARPPVEGTRNPVANPTAPLPMPAEDVVQGLDAVVVTHRHRDHLDGTAEELLPRDVPVFCQPEDEGALRELGLDARGVDEDVEWKGLLIVRTPARHGTGPIADALAPVSGFVLDGLYIAGDTVWYEGVEQTIERHRPRVAVVNAGGAEFTEGGLIIMGVDDVREVAARVPTVVAVHLEALNHCYVTRAALQAELPEVLVPADGETLDLD